MHAEDPAADAPQDSQSAGSFLIPAIVCSGLSVIFYRIGFLNLFFLVPLGICAAAYSPAAAWRGALLAILGNGVCALGFSARSGFGPANAGVDMLYFSSFTAGFAWIMAGSPLPAIPRVRTLFRFIAAAAAGALSLILMAFFLFKDEGRLAVIYEIIEAMVSPYAASLAMDARLFAPDGIIEVFLMILIRGGAMYPAFFLLFLSRQAALIVTGLFRLPQAVQPGYAGSGGLIGFHAPRKTIRVLALCLPVILLCRKAASLQLIEVAAWNLLVVCIIIFMAQGGGIVLFNIARRVKSRTIRMACILAAVIAVFSPGLNAMVFCGLVLLGIVETWLPLRKINYIKA